MLMFYSATTSSRYSISRSMNERNRHLIFEEGGFDELLESIRRHRPNDLYATSGAPPSDVQRTVRHRNSSNSGASFMGFHCLVWTLALSIALRIIRCASAASPQ